MDRLSDDFPFFVYVLDFADHTIPFANSKCLEMLGEPSHSVVAEGVTFFVSRVHPDDRERLSWHDQRCASASAGEALETLVRMRHRRGDWRWIRRRDTVIERSDDGRVLRIQGVAEDVTDCRLREMNLIRHHERVLGLLARDLHDALVQDIVGAQMCLESIIANLEPSQTECLQDVIVLRGLLHKAANEGRRMITSLRPMVIDEAGVVEAIRYLVGEEEASERLNVSLFCSVQFERLAPILEGTIFRIVQQSLDNVARHAGVREVSLRLQQTGAVLQIDVEDQGCGFDAQQSVRPQLGLAGIREQAQLLGGYARIESRPGCGTAVHVELPLTLPTEWHDARGGW